MDRVLPERLVRPRVIDQEGGSDDPLLIDEAIERRIAQGEHVKLFVCGPPGSGKRTALEYLRALFGARAEVAFGPRTKGAHSALEPIVRISVSLDTDSNAPAARRQLELVPWTRDEWIEYLLANHPLACAGVMARLEASEEIDLKGRAVLWAAILDALALDPALPSACAALRAAVRARFADGANYARAIDAAWQAVSNPLDVAHAAPRFRKLVEREPAAAPFLAQSCVHVLLGTERLVNGLAGLEPAAKLPPRLAPEILKATRALLVRHPAAQETLAGILRDPTHPAHASAASLLHLYGPTALPEFLRWLHARSAGPPHLSGAQLPGLVAPDADLRRVELQGALLSGARLDGAELGHAHLGRADLCGASLRGARLERAEAQSARFVGADLRGAMLEAAELTNAVFDEALLEGANLLRAQLSGASLRGACLDGADLCGAVLRGADVSRASFMGADLSNAVLDGVDLRRARLATTLFASASLVRCILEEVVLEEPDLSGADLGDALLTASHFVRADLQGARLAGAGLAHVDWEHANLMKADLTRASFHLGSSRSGLALGAPASGGTRTGFYDEDLRERGVKTPEEIRKANLRFADLRGARIFHTDFYLVDLRGAFYTPDQEQHLRTCGAILGS